MACDITTILEAACDSDIGKVRDDITLLVLIAQTAADWLVSIDSGASITPEAILARACTSGVGKMTDENSLLAYIAQQLCTMGE